jgi:rSAM/selenodomain-associated transferase 2
LISVIIPTLDEELALPDTLAAVLSQVGDFELMVVDGGSLDRTPEIVQDAARAGHPVRLISTDRGRARQMNAGAQEARGDWLLFLHADTRLPEDALSSIEGLPESVEAGCFHHRFSGRGVTLRVLSWCHNRRFAVTRVIYGDQALFIRHRLFERLGGFPLRPMEDIAFGLVLRRVTRPTMLDGRVVTDSRKFDTMGHWRAVYRAVSLLVRFRLGADVAFDPFFDDYR